MNEAEAKAREIVKTLDDPWGDPIANDVVESCVQAISQALLAARREGMEEAARIALPTCPACYEAIRSKIQSSSNDKECA